MSKHYVVDYKSPTLSDNEIIGSFREESIQEGNDINGEVKADTGI